MVTYITFKDHTPLILAVKVIFCWQMGYMANAYSIVSKLYDVPQTNYFMRINVILFRIVIKLIFSCILLRLHDHRRESNPDNHIQQSNIIYPEVIYYFTHIKGQLPILNILYEKLLFFIMRHCHNDLLKLTIKLLHTWPIYLFI